jgi:hypothetical protein
MDRRGFLLVIGAASVAQEPLGAAPPPPPATVIYDDRVVTLDRVRFEAKDPAALWIWRRDLPAVNGFEVKPQGACREDICVPIPKSMIRGEYFDVTAFARKAGQAVVVDTAARAWSFGEIQALRGGFLSSRTAPDVAMPDRAGRPVQLSRFHGKKMLLITWASW